MSIEKELTERGMTLSVRPLPTDQCFTFIQCDIKRMGDGRHPQISFSFPGTHPELKQSDMILWVSAAMNLIRESKAAADELYVKVQQ